jgi:hypothetical protein
MGRDAFRKMMEIDEDLLDSRSGHMLDMMLEDGLPRDRNHDLGHLIGQRTEPRPLARRKQDGFPFPAPQILPSAISDLM